MPANPTTPLDPAVYARVFENHAEGVQILEELIRKFGRRPPTIKGGVDAVLATYRNGGNAEVLDWIVNRINRAHGVHDDDRSDDQ